MTARLASALAMVGVLATGVSIVVARQGRAERHAAAPVVAVAGPATRAYTDKAGGVTVAYPAGWHATTAATAELSVADPAETVTLRLDVPAMPFHPPFIPVGLVATRYVEALRQAQVPDAKATESADLAVPGATARRVTAAGHAAGGATACVDTAVILVHKGQIYLLSCDSDAAHAPAARAALDAAVASVRWGK